VNESNRLRAPLHSASPSRRCRRAQGWLRVGLAGQLDRLPAAYAHGAPGAGGLAELVLRARAAAALLGVHRSDTAGARAEGELRAWNLLVEGLIFTSWVMLTVRRSI